MMYAALSLLALCVSAKPQLKQRLVAHNDEYSESGDEPTICYGDDECRDKQVCDMGSYICVDPTPSPVLVTPSPTDAPGCCYGDSYKANDKCVKATDRARCESMGCSFLETDDPNDCVVTTTTEPTTTIEAGCCYGNTAKTNAMCAEKDGRDSCERSGKCEFRAGADADCELVTTDEPTTTIEIGCCYSEDRKKLAMCNEKTDRKSCERSNSCLFLAGDPFACDLVWDTTTSTPEAEGCCYGDSYKANGKCARATSQSKCEDMGCAFLVTDDPTDCEMTTTESPTTTTEVGCCKGDSAKTNSMCNSRLTRAQCDRSSSCSFIVDGTIEDECFFPPTAPPEEPGCCYGNPDAAYSKRWMDACTSYSTERECLLLTDDGGMTRCVFEPMNEYMDCAMLWPTTTTTTDAPGCCYGSSYKAQAKCLGLDRDMCARKGCEFLETEDETDCELTTTATPTTTVEPGCCKADSKKREAMCLARDTREKCEKSSSCVEWISGEGADCSIAETTTENPGCCYINPAMAYSKKYQETCIAFGTERDCLKLTDAEGLARCVFEPMNEYEDCEALWPTTTETPTEEPGCCYSDDSYKANDKCARATSRSKCEDMGCSFLVTDDVTDCEVTTTESPTTTVIPGCCKGTSRTSNDACNDIEDADQCDRRSSCTFIAFGDVLTDCQFPVTSPPEDPGCCYGNPDIAYSKRWMDSCKTFGFESECLMLTNEDGEPRCTFEPMGEYEDCETVWPTTTTTTDAPGCCYGSSYKAQAKCLGLDRDMCARKGCEFLETENEDDCILTTTESPTTTVIPGCCKGTSRTSNDACNAIEDADQCDRRSSCTFIAFGVIEEDCQFPVTSPPEDPGCCYGNPDIAYSKRWMDSCKTFGTESECTMLTDGEGVPRCVFEPMGEYEDCETVWPTTTQTPTEPAGCCYSADSYKANDKCARATSQSKCQDMGCSFLITDDPSECEMTTTESPTTTTEVGCCYGEGVKENEMCGNKVGRALCERNDACEFRSGADADCELPTTTSEPWLGAQDEAAEEYALPYNPYKSAQSKSRKSSKAGRRQEQAMLFGADSAVGQAMQYQISLSSALIMLCAAFALYQAAKWLSARKNKDYAAVQTRPAQYYQSA